MSALTALVEGTDVRAPGVGVWRPAIGLGQVIRPGDLLGLLEILGAAHRVIAPAGVRGLVVAVADGAAGKARVAVDHGARLFVLDPSGVISAEAAVRSSSTSPDEAGLVFRAPTSGRFYSRSSPGKPPFVAAGAVVRDGQTVCMLEVMKTFNRVVYEAGSGLPAEARVVEVAVADEADVDAGAVLLRLEVVG